MHNHNLVCIHVRLHQPACKYMHHFTIISCQYNWGFRVCTSLRCKYMHVSMTTSYRYNWSLSQDTYVYITNVFMTYNQADALFLKFRRESYCSGMLQCQCHWLYLYIDIISYGGYCVWNATSLSNWCICITIDNIINKHVHIHNLQCGMSLSYIAMSQMCKWYIPL